MRFIEIKFSRRKDFLKSYLDNIPDGGFFLTSTENFTIGEKLSVLIKLPDIDGGILINTTVLWIRHPASQHSALKPGIGVAFSHNDSGRRDFLIDFCKGRLDLKRKTDRRIPINFTADFRKTGDKDWIPARAGDISRNGIYIITNKPLNIEDGIEMNLLIDESGIAELFEGKVVWINNSQRSVNTGMGVEFIFEKHVLRRLVEEFILEIEGKLIY